MLFLVINNIFNLLNYLINNIWKENLSESHKTSLFVSYFVNMVITDVGIILRLGAFMVNESANIYYYLSLHELTQLWYVTVF